MGGGGGGEGYGRWKKGEDWVKKGAERVSFRTENAVDFNMSILS